MRLSPVCHWQCVSISIWASPIFLLHLSSHPAADEAGSQCCKTTNKHTHKQTNKHINKQTNHYCIQFFQISCKQWLVIWGQQEILKEAGVVFWGTWAIAFSIECCPVGNLWHCKVAKYILFGNPVLLPCGEPLCLPANLITVTCLSNRRATRVSGDEGMLSYATQMIWKF